MKANILKFMDKAIAKTKFKVKANSPEILLVTGLCAMAYGAFEACVATTKFEETIKQPKEEKEEIKEYVEDNGYSEMYTENDYKLDMVRVNTRMGVEVAKLYAVPLTFFGMGVCCILGSHRIIKNRYLGMSAAYAILDNQFKEYRNRVVERLGERYDYELKHGITKKEIEVVETNENGETEVTKKTVDFYDGVPNQYSEYSRFFDCGNPNWEKSPEYNKSFLVNMEQVFNSKLRAHKYNYIFLNEVYVALGFEPTLAGQHVGWIYDEDNPTGDNYISFGIHDVYRHPAAGDFVNGMEASIILDFNVDGDIYKILTERNQEKFNKNKKKALLAPIDAKCHTIGKLLKVKK